MVEAIPKWVMVRYAAIYKKVRCRKFFREEVKEILNASGLNSGDKLTNVFFSELNKKGWVEIKRDEKDKRKKIFKLISPEKAILNLYLKEDKNERHERI